MSELPPDLERRPEGQLTVGQDKTLRLLCERYGVEFVPAHYYVYPEDSFIMPGWAEGWIGGPAHATDEYRHPSLPSNQPTIYVGVSPEGGAHS